MIDQPVPPVLDPRRWFTAAEVTAAWLRQDCKCAECQREVPRDLVEGDHIIPWSAGGPTTMENLQALCIACNRRKGIQEGVIAEGVVASVAVATAPLWGWQERALPVVMAATRPVLIEACPGAGKTRFALECVARLFDQHVVNRVLIVVPTSRLADQWVEAGSGMGGSAVVPLAPAGWRPTQPLFRRWAGAAFTYHALFAQTTMIEALAAEPGYRTLVIFDEVHHAGSEHAWGIAAQQAFMSAATRIVSLSGTAFRTKDPIVFIQTRDGRSVADFTYNYGDALRDKVCRPLQFVAIGGTATFKTPAGQVETVTFEDELNEQGESYRLRTVLSTKGNHLRETLRTANDELIRLRTSTDPDAGGLVVCIDCDHADAVARILQEITGTRPTVACSRLNDPDDPSPRPGIEVFDRGTSPWIVSVRMVSEGVDIRRLRVLVYATNMATELGFRQITGRLVRTDPKNTDSDYGLVILPAEPILLSLAQRILDEVPLAERGPLVIRDPATRTTNIYGGHEKAQFVPLGSTGELTMVTDTDGRSAPAELVAAAKRYVAATGSPVPPFELALAAAHDEHLRNRLLDY
ncbi:MAG: DEAD/DEAH box helicase family protein [Candidatus Dormibacteria bacterium]